MGEHSQENLVLNTYDVSSEARGLNFDPSPHIIYIHTLCIQVTRTLVSLHICPGSPEPLFFDNAISPVPKSQVLSNFTFHQIKFCFCCILPVIKPGFYYINADPIFSLLGVSLLK